jgi:AcrR family transcriptional regulator
VVGWVNVHSPYYTEDLAETQGGNVTTRDTILDGALEVMRTRGLARTTTKEIARAAGVSEALLYKLFTDKTDLFLCVFAERLPWGMTDDDFADLVGKNTVAGNLTTILVEIERLFDATMPIAMSLISDIGLLTREAEAIKERGGPGPGFIIQRVSDYLRAEQGTGRVRTTAMVDAAAVTLVGACMHHAFVALYVRESDERQKAFAVLADGVAATVVHGIAPD